jgi:hypothetical protein
MEFFIVFFVIYPAVVLKLVSLYYMYGITDDDMQL